MIWNAFVDLLAVEDYADLTPLQRQAHLVFWYESEVQNGGHGQYFENRGLGQLTETVDALTELGLPCQAGILARAAEGLAPRGAEADWAAALNDDFIEELDDAFHSCTPDVVEALQKHLEAHQADYVELT